MTAALRFRSHITLDKIICFILRQMNAASLKKIRPNI
jgi:hypothetical protein